MGDAEFAGVENVGVKNTTPHCSGGKRHSGNRGRREIMESEHFNNMLLNVRKSCCLRVGPRCDVTCCHQ